MRALLNLLMVLAASIVLSAQQAGSNQPSLGAEQEIRRLQDALIDAYLHHDYAVLDGVLADDYTYIDDDGFVLNKQQILDEFNSGDDKISSYKRQDEKVRVFGGSAITSRH